MRVCVGVRGCVNSSEKIWADYNIKNGVMQIIFFLTWEKKHSKMVATGMKFLLFRLTKGKEYS